MTKKVIRAMLAVVAACAVALGGLHVRANEESVTVTPPEGGEWTHGANGGRVWSTFLHPEPHAASVHGHTYVDSGCVAGDTWARAQAPSKWVPITKNKHERRLC